MVFLHPPHLSDIQMIFHGRAELKPEAEEMGSPGSSDLSYVAVALLHTCRWPFVCGEVSFYPAWHAVKKLKINSCQESWTSILLCSLTLLFLHYLRATGIPIFSVNDFLSSASQSQLDEMERVNWQMVWAGWFRINFCGIWNELEELVLISLEKEGKNS